MSPREVIARAIFIGDYDEDERWDECPDLHRVYFKMADAVIDALASMEVTEAMGEAAWNAPGFGVDRNATACALWRAMVGAMRDE
jgi:hypothetical protein